MHSGNEALVNSRELDITFVLQSGRFTSII